MKRCRHCGTASEDDARFCSYCGRNFDDQYSEYSSASQEQKPAPEGQYKFSGDAPPLPPNSETYNNYGEPQVKPPNNSLVWLILSIVMTCCCSPLQIATIIISAIALSKYNQGDYEESKRLSKIAMIVFFSLLALSIIAMVWLVSTGWFDQGFEEFYQNWY